MFLMIPLRDKYHIWQAFDRVLPQVFLALLGQTSHWTNLAPASLSLWSHVESLRLGFVQAVVHLYTHIHCEFGIPNVYGSMFQR